MSSKTLKILYWTLLTLFSAFILMDGIGGILQAEAGKQSMDQLGYPYYLMTMLGIAKILGVAALFQDRFPRLKEWAFAGFTLNFIGAAVSWAFVEGPLINILLPVVILAFMLVIYALWKKQIKIEADLI